MQNRFHACATCIHFRIKKTENSMKYYCDRLGFETNPKYKFRCWTPMEHVEKLMNKKRENNEGKHELDC